jgi:type II secretion system protein N
VSRFTQIALGILWFGLAFLISFYVTFPTDAVKERIRYEIHAATDGEYTLELDSVGPWWVGLALHDVRLFSKGRDAQTGQPSDVLAFMASRARVASTLTSLLASTPAVSGDVTLLEGGTLDFAVETALNKKGTRLELTRLEINGPDLPIADLGAAAGVVGTGSIDIKVDIDAPDGLRSADGDIVIESSGISLSEVGDMLPPLGFDIPIDRIALTFDLKKGRAKIKKGDIESGFGQVELDGEITLRENIGASTYRLTVIISDLTPPDGMGPLVEGALASAKWADSTYHYSCSGSLERPRGCVPQRERSSRSGRTSRPSPRPAASSRGTSTSPNSGTTAVGSRSAEKRDDDDIRERIRLRREDRERRLKREEREQLDELGYDEEGFDEMGEELGYEDGEGFQDFFDEDVQVEDLERAFEEAFQE